MTTAVKVSVIGAGSATFSLGLVKDLCLTESLAGSLVSFMDIDEARLDMITTLAARYAQELGADLHFERCADRRASMQDADFVINTAAVRSHDHQVAVRELIAKRGYYHRMGHRIPGSFYNFQLMLAVARDMEDVCPDAWLIQSGNPVFDGCTLMTRETDIKICGLCHGHYGVLEIARTIGLDLSNPADLTWQAPGLNHNIWLTHFIYQGENAYPLIDEWIATRAEEYWRTHIPTRTHDIQMSRGAVHQYRLYGVFPIGDTVRRGGWWYHTDLPTKKHWFGEPWGGPDTDVGRPVHVKELEARIAHMTALANDPQASLVEALGAEKTREQQVPIIDALTNDHEGQFQVNVPNNGSLPGIPDNVVVELPAVINKKGIQTLNVGHLPRKVMLEHVMPEWLEMERGLEAFKTGDLSMLLWSALHTHQTRSYDQAVAVLDDLLAMDGHEEMKEYLRYPPHTQILTEKHDVLD